MTQEPRLIETFALKLINKRGLFVQELESLLLNANFDNESILKLGREFAEKGLVSDRMAFSELELFVESHDEVTASSLRAKLIKRSLSEEFIDHLIARLFDPEKASERAMAAVKKKYKPGTPAPKIYRYLVSKGYEPDIAESVAESWNSHTE